MNKRNLEYLAELRAKEANALLSLNFFEGSYYLSGYSLECAIKACIAKQVKEFDFPNKELAQKSHQHKLSELIGVAGLKQKLTEKMKQDSNFEINWALAKDWTVESRYESQIDEHKARDLYNAVTDDKSGVLVWLKTFW
ncbi:DNA-binding protein [Psychrobacter glaciei]|uniref:DNA-binding protein n=1 Tax=Psychrobacter glaciei TaxID=619771 RepID=UPI003F472FCC